MGIFWRLSALFIVALVWISPVSAQIPGGVAGVTSVAVTCGIATSGSTGAITIGGETVDNAISGITDTINSGDCGRTERYTGASAAVTVPASAGFPVSFTTDIKCETTVSACTLTPSSTTINGSASVISIAIGNSITLYLDLSGTPVWHTKPGNGPPNLSGTGSRPVCVTANGLFEAGSLAAGLVTCP